MNMSRATKKNKWITELKSNAKALQHFTVGQVGKIDATFHGSLDLCVQPAAYSLQSCSPYVLELTTTYQGEDM